MPLRDGRSETNSALVTDRHFFSVGGDIVPNKLDVYVNGVRLADGELLSFVLQSDLNKPDWATLVLRSNAQNNRIGWVALAVPVGSGDVSRKGTSGQSVNVRKVGKLLGRWIGQIEPC